MTDVTLEVRWEKFRNTLSRDWSADQVNAAKLAWFSGAIAATAEISRVAAASNSGAELAQNLIARLEEIRDEGISFIQETQRRFS